MKVDIIIPAYHGIFLEETLNSCVSQTYDNYEIIVIDNQSPVDIKSICNNFTKVNYIKAPNNGGPSGGRNIGIRNSSADLISFIDDDDNMCPNKLADSVQAFQQHPDIGMTCGNYRIMVNGRIRQPFYKRAVSINHAALMKINYVASGSTTVKKEVFDKVGLFDERYWIAEDYDMWVRISEQYPIHFINKVLYHYRIIPGSKSLTQRQDIQKKHSFNLNQIKISSLKRMNNGKNI